MLSIVLIALTVLSLLFKWWFVFVVFTLCGFMALIGLYALALIIRSFWFQWRLVLDQSLRRGSFIWKTAVRSQTQSFSFDDIQSIDVGSSGSDKDGSKFWLVAINFHDKPSWGMGTADEREVAVEYAGRLAHILGTGVAEKPAD